jgi:hypothetical protein
MPSWRCDVLMAASVANDHRPVADDSSRWFQEASIYTVIHQYTFDPQSGATLNRTIREEFVPLLRAAPGFVAYYWLDIGDGSGASFSVFEDQAGANAALDLAAYFVDQQPAALVGKPDIIKGEVKVYANCGL